MVVILLQEVGLEKVLRLVLCFICINHRKLFDLSFLGSLWGEGIEWTYPVSNSFICVLSESLGVNWKKKAYRPTNLPALHLGKLLSVLGSCPGFKNCVTLIWLGFFPLCSLRNKINPEFIFVLSHLKLFSCSINMIIINFVPVFVLSLQFCEWLKLLIRDQRNAMLTALLGLLSMAYMGISVSTALPAFLIPFTLWMAS